MASKPELVYFDGRGRGEIVRIALVAAGIEFKETDVHTREEFLTYQPNLLFNQIPLLKIDGQDIVQTAAIVRHVARKGNLVGVKEPEVTKIDTLYEGSRDFMSPFLGIGFITEESKIGDHKHVVERYLNIFNKVLKENGTGYLVGSHLTLADVGLLEPVLATVDYFGLEFLNQYPDVLKYYKTVTGLDRIQKYLKEIRKPKNSPEYIKTVKTVLAW